MLYRSLREKDYPLSQKPIAGGVCSGISRRGPQVLQTILWSSIHSTKGNKPFLFYIDSIFNLRNNMIENSKYCCDEKILFCLKLAKIGMM